LLGRLWLHTRSPGNWVATGARIHAGSHLYQLSGIDIDGRRHAFRPYLIAHDAVLAATFRLVHGHVGRGDELLDGCAIGRIGDEPDRDRGANVAVGDAQRDGRDVASQLFSHHETACRVGLRQQHHELVPTVASCRVSETDGVTDDIGDGTQESVAPLVSEGIVHRLEVVQVQHGETTTHTVRPTDLLFHGGEEEGPVVEARKGIETRRSQGLPL
jgi:hypothetical protein